MLDFPKGNHVHWILQCGLTFCVLVNTLTCYSWTSLIQKWYRVWDILTLPYAGPVVNGFADLSSFLCLCVSMYQIASCELQWQRTVLFSTFSWALALWWPMRPYWDLDVPDRKGTHLEHVRVQPTKSPHGWWNWKCATKYHFYGSSDTRTFPWQWSLFNIGSSFKGKGPGGQVKLKLAVCLY